MNYWKNTTNTEGSSLPCFQMEQRSYCILYGVHLPVLGQGCNCNFERVLICFITK